MSAGVDRAAAQPRLAREQFRDQLLAFFRLERAGAEDDGAAGHDEVDGVREQPPLQIDQRGEIASRA